MVFYYIIIISTTIFELVLKKHKKPIQTINDHNLQILNEILITTVFLRIIHFNFIIFAIQK